MASHGLENATRLSASGTRRGPAWLVIPDRADIGRVGCMRSFFALVSEARSSTPSSCAGRAACPRGGQYELLASADDLADVIGCEANVPTDARAWHVQVGHLVTQPGLDTFRWAAASSMLSRRFGYGAGFPDRHGDDRCDGVGRSGSKPE